MTPERWKEVQRVFHDALERPAEVRPAYVAEACGADAELRAEVASLLRSAEEGTAFLETPPEGAALPDPPPARIGPYRVLDELGRGGMGYVFLATRADEQFKKKVAIKVVRQGMDPDAVRRFRQERQILAGLEHPNIARLLDGGSTGDGRPYVVLEYVEGQNLLAWCDAHGLGVAERITLFRTVCRAVQYAHQNLVVHRDLKPANILVTADGTPKLLDFGIAKLLNAGVSDGPSDVTLAAQRLLTPEYASPEQVRGERITTASDVYSLGVVLFELLTAKRPYRFETGSPDEVARAVCEQEPERPSAVCRREWRKAIAGDLDTIVLKALRKEPGRRYVSAEQLAEDLRRHAAGLPVTAQRDTLGYRAGKFFRRHRLAAAAAGVVLVTLLGGIAATARQARIARAEKLRADLRLQDVRKLAGSFLFEFHDAIATLPGSTPARELIVRRALEYLGTLAKEGGTDPALQRELAGAYQKLGDVQGMATWANLGDTAGARESYKAALAILEPLATDPSGSPRDRDELAACHLRLSKVAINSWEIETALDHARRVVELREELRRSGTPIPDPLNKLGSAYHNLGLVLSLRGEKPAALTALRKSLQEFEAARRANPGDVHAQRGIGLARFEIASVHHHLGELRDAAENGRESLAVREALLAADPLNARLKTDFMATLADVGTYASELGDLDAAVAHHRRAVSIAEELTAADPKNTYAQVALGYYSTELGVILAKRGDAREALRLHRYAAEVTSAVLAANPANGFARRNLAIICGNAGDAANPSETKGPGRAEERRREAAVWYRKSLAAWRELQATGKLSDEDAKAVAAVTERLARCEVDTGTR